MEIVKMREGMVVVKPTNDLYRGNIKLLNPEMGFKKGVVQDMGMNHPAQVGFMEGDTVMYIGFINFTDELDVVEIDKIVLVCQNQ